MQGRIQNFKLGGVHLKKIVPSRGRREHFGGYFVWKITILCKKIIFFSNFRGGARRVHPPLNPPLSCVLKIHVYILSVMCIRTRLIDSLLLNIQRAVFQLIFRTIKSRTKCICLCMKMIRNKGNEISVLSNLPMQSLLLSSHLY